MTPYWTGSTPKRRSAPVSEGPSGALGATEAGQTPVPGIHCATCLRPLPHTDAEQIACTAPNEGIEP